MFRVKVLHLVHLQQHAGGGIIVLPSFLRCHWQYFSAVIDVVGMHLLADNVCRNELNVKVRNSILSVEHQEWRSHQVLVGVTREYNLYLYVTGVIICFTVSHVDSATTNRLRISRENQEEESGVSEWWRCAGVDALTSCHSSRGWNWLDLLFPASRQAECSTLNRAGDDVEILSAQTWNKRGKHIFNHSCNILILNGSREIYM